MKFSILITSFNKGKYIEECINSCLNQVFKDYEIILLDNCSQDNTYSIVSKYKNKIKFIKKKRVSKYPAMNQIDLLIKGFKISKGKTICLLDGDDLFYKNKLQVLNKVLKNKVDVVFDLPMIKDRSTIKKFKLNNKIQKNIWPTIIPTSSITMKRVFFKHCLDTKLFHKFNYLEVDFRINILSRNILKNFKIIKNDLSFYRKVENGIMSKIKKFSKIWWVKRLEAHNFMKYIYKKNRIKYENKIDYHLSKVFSSLN